MTRHHSFAQRLIAAGFAIALAGAAAAHAGDNFTKPTAEELAMTAVPGYPGVAAVVLNEEVITDDDNHSQVHYQRIKILTEKGKEYANVELRFASSKGDGYYEGNDKSITDIQGRTIHPDGTIIPFTGKPYTKMLENASAYKYQARMFTLPDVEVGSIIEYRYVVRIGDNVVESPDWYIQGPLFVKAAHYEWRPTTREVSSVKGVDNTIVWYPILPEGVSVVKVQKPTGAQTFTVNVKDVPPIPVDDFMPPIESFTYRVLFGYSPYRTQMEFWKSEGGDWSKRVNSFAGPDGALSTATQQIVAGAATQDEKLRRIYATVMSLENTDFTRSRDQKEEKAEGLGKTNRASDVLAHKRGDGNQLTELFVGMARAAGMKAYLMLVPSRSHSIFAPQWLNLYQADSILAIVNVDGKEMYFDPGARYCDYGKLVWSDTYASGIRQTDNGIDFGKTPGDTYTVNVTKRIGDLVLDEKGEIHGKLIVTYTGAPALDIRHRALRGDEESLHHGLRTDMEEILPHGLEVKVESVIGIADYDKPLVVQYTVKGGMGTSTGKRLLLPADVFVAEEKEAFPHEKRDLPVYFHYAQSIQDAVRIKYPANLMIEGGPEKISKMFQTAGAYSLSADQKPGSITTQRSLLFNTILVSKADYATLRSFYSELQSKDKEPIILKAAAPAPAAGAN